MTCLAAVLVFGGFGCKGQSQAVIQASRPFTLKIWTVYDDQDSYQDIIAAYRALHPNVTVQVTKFTYAEYQKKLLNALAVGDGPDIFSLHNTWMGEWQPRLAPMPPSMTIPFREMQGTIRKQAVTVLKQVPGMSLAQLKNDFVDAVYEDVVLPTAQADPRAPLVPRIYGLPMSMDTMAMYYNKDLLNENGIAQPATDWQQFQDQVKKMTRFDQVGTIIQSGAAIGSSANVERSADLLELLMMQNGASMTDNNGTATFDKYPPELAGRPLPPGAEALVFYTDFANPQKEVYTWNANMPDSLDAFVSGKAAYFFGYDYDLATIRQRAPNLNFGIAPMPQIAGNSPINFPNYWVNAVSKKSAHVDQAWDFVQFMSNADNTKAYLARTHLPTARRDLVNSQLNDLDLSVFASQAPSAKSWYHGTDSAAMETAFTDMIDQMLASTSPDPAKIVGLGATKVNQTIP